MDIQLIYSVAEKVAFIGLLEIGARAERWRGRSKARKICFAERCYSVVSPQAAQ
jgi:hypothetical protein